MCVAACDRHGASEADRGGATSFSNFRKGKPKGARRFLSVTKLTLNYRMTSPLLKCGNLTVEFII
jgi:hypothetical protein